MNEKKIKKIVEKTVIDVRNKRIKKDIDTIVNIIICVPILCITCLITIATLVCLYTLFQEFLIKIPILIFFIVCSTFVISVIISNWIGKKWIGFWKDDD